MKSRYWKTPWPLRILAALLILIAYFGIYRPGEDEQSALYGATADIEARRAVAHDALLHAKIYIASAKAIATELGNVRVSGDERESMSSLVIDLDRRARSRAVELEGLEPQRTAVNPRGLEFIIRIRGRYGAVLHFCDDLALVHDLLELETIDLARDPKTVRSGAPPVLDATLRVLLLRGGDLTMPENSENSVNPVAQNISPLSLTQRWSMNAAEAHS